jgi:hypothetical protein
MTYSVYQHWDKLKVCVVGRSYPPEFFAFVENNQARYVLERIAQETEEDLQNFISFVQARGIKILRPMLSDNLKDYHLNGRYLPPPLTPRDDIGMIGERFFMPQPIRHHKWEIIKGNNWPALPPQNDSEWNNLPAWLRKELLDRFNIDNLIDIYDKDHNSLSQINEFIKENGNEIIYNQSIDSAMICRVGKDLYCGTWNVGVDHLDLRKKLETIFPDYRCHIIETGGHLDGVFCPIKEGLIFSSRELDRTVFDKHFPGWEVVYIDQSINSLNPKFKDLKKKNNGKWWVPGEEENGQFTNFVEHIINNWIGYCEETVIGVNLLMLDENNLVCVKEDEKIFKILEKHNITSHVLPFRHYNFWDSGWHCLTADIHREGTLKDYFPERKYATGL